MTTVNNKSNPNLHLTLDELGERVEGLAAQGNADTYQIGVYYNHMVERDLAKTGGFKNAADFFQKRVKGLSQSMLTMFGAVARAFVATACVKYGMSKLYALLSYEKLAGITADGNEPGSTPIQVPMEDGTVESKPFAECTVEELKLAVKHKRTPPTPLPTSATARVELYRSVLDKHFGKESHILVSARVERGKVLISLKDIPDEQMSQLAEVLMDRLTSANEAA
jgi:hypothetical protein